MNRHDQFNEQRVQILTRRRAAAQAQSQEHAKAGFEQLAQNAKDEAESIDRQMTALASAIGLHPDSMYGGSEDDRG